MTREINIRLNANCAKAVHTGHKFVSGDKGIVFRIAVESMDTTGTTAKIVFKRSNGTSVEANITEENGVYCYTTLGNEFAVVGPVTADVKFYEGEKRISTCTFVFDVTADTLDGIGGGTGGYSDTLERMKESMEQTESEMLEVKRDMEAYAEAFLGAYPFNPRGAYSETESYTVRDMVTHNDVAWVCYKDCTGAPPGEDSDCWMPLAIKVVDAETLDGHGAEYFLSKAGGTLKGDLNVQNAEEATRLTIRLQNKLRQIINRVYEDGSYKLYDMTNNKDIIVSKADGTNTLNGTASGNLPLDGGGTVLADRLFPIALKNTGNNVSYTRYEGKDGILGFLGFSASNTPTVLNNSGGTLGMLLHTGNKPTGTYTGNGDATTRTIAIGGIGETLRIFNTSYGIAFIGKYGGVGIGEDGNYIILPSEGKFENGALTMASTSNFLNANTYVYEYDLL